MRYLSVSQGTPKEIPPYFYWIDPQGNVDPCAFLWAVRFCNVFNQDFSVIIKEAQETRFIQAREQGFKGR